MFPLRPKVVKSKLTYYSSSFLVIFAMSRLPPYIFLACIMGSFLFRFIISGKALLLRRAG